MALNNKQLTNVRQKLARGRNPNWKKQQINAAAQAVDGEITNAVAAARTAINDLGFPFSSAVKNKIILAVFRERAG